MAGDISAPETLPVSPGDPLLLSEKDGPQIGLGPRIFHQQKHSRAFYLAPYFTYRETMVQRGRGSQTDVSLFIQHPLRSPGPCAGLPGEPPALCPWVGAPLDLWLAVMLR